MPRVLPSQMIPAIARLRVRFTHGSIPPLPAILNHLVHNVYLAVPKDALRSRLKVRKVGLSLFVRLRLGHNPGQHPVTLAQLDSLTRSQPGLEPLGITQLTQADGRHAFIVPIFARTFGSCATVEQTLMETPSDPGGASWPSRGGADI